MKGDINPIIFAILAVGIVIVAIFLLSGNIGRFTAKMSVEECKQKMQASCSSFTTTGNPAIFRDVPQTCADVLGISAPFKECVAGNRDRCRVMCDTIEIGTVTPEVGGELGIEEIETGMSEIAGGIPQLPS